MRTGLFLSLIFAAGSAFGQYSYQYNYPSGSPQAYGYSAISPRTATIYSSDGAEQKTVVYPSGPLSSSATAYQFAFTHQVAAYRPDLNQPDIWNYTEVRIYAAKNPYNQNYYNYPWSLTISQVDNLNNSTTLLYQVSLPEITDGSTFAVVTRPTDGPNGQSQGIYVRIGGNRYYYRTALPQMSSWANAFYDPFSDTNTNASAGAVETTAPTAPANLTSSISNGVAALSWSASTDSGIGDVRYAVFAGTTLLTETANTTYSITMQPGDNLTITVKALDGHRNFSTGVSTTANYPLVTQIWDDSRRVGIHALSSQWGAMGESIDTRSMNMNFSIPLLKAAGRNGQALGLGLSYNSQNWRRDSGTSYKIGADVGYGFGWRLMAGSVVPVWTAGPTFAYYLFTDSTGAEYKLDQNSGNIWSTKLGSTVKYDPNANKVIFKDGTTWLMGSLAAASEQDAGARYPTVIQDRNGNQIIVTYQPALGSSTVNTSARVQRIEDIRGVYDNNGYYKTYVFTYNTDAIPHLTGITNMVGTSEVFSFNYSGANTLVEPFASGTGFGSAVWLNSITNSIAQTESFGYNSAGEMTSVTFPLGGSFAWTYATQIYSSTKQIRELQSRSFVKASGATAVSYAFTHTAPGAKYHAQTTLTDPSNQGQRRWTFSTANDWTQGLETLYEAIDKVSGSWVTRSQSAKTWAQYGGNGLIYVSESLETIEPGTGNQKQSKTTQTIAANGDVLSSAFYGFDSLTTALKTTSCNYYSYGLPTSCTTTQGSETLSAASTAYDGGSLTALPYGTRLWADPGTSVRGLATSWTDGVNSGSASYNQAGQPLNTAAGGVSTSTTYSSSGAGSSVPQSITPGGLNSLSVSMNFNGALNLTSITPASENGVSFGYDGVQRKTTDTSKDGATTNYTYASNGSWMQATINGRWTKTTFDGIGRAVKVESGDANGTKAIVETQYEPCACSPVGKMKRTSLPYAPGGSPIWTEYTYDGLGRVVSVAQPNNSGTTTYSYTGVSVTTTSPAGRWKTYENNALGQLVKVTEPRPGGGTYQTTYAYNIVGKLTTVTMPRDGYTQTRTFVYDATTKSRLTSATNPENGTVTYTYNLNGTLASKLDAKNIRTEFSYDSLNRTTEMRKYLTNTTAEDRCQRVNYAYNSAGKLSTASWNWDASGNPCSVGSTGKSIGFQESYSYYATGRVQTKTLGFTRTESGTQVSYTLPATWTYNNEGQVTQLNYPTRTINGNATAENQTFTYDSMARPAGSGWNYFQWNWSMQMTETKSGGVSGVQYNVFGAMTNMTVQGISGYSSETRSYNALGQLTGITNPGNTVTYTYSATQNDGKILSANDIQYQYDELERLISAVSSNANGWGLSFSYDGFGNRLSQAVTKGSAPTNSTLVDVATNRISSFGYAYDANGNMTNMPQNSAQMTYDASNRMVNYSGTNGSETYAYAPDNRRVWRSGLNANDPNTDSFTLYAPGGQKLGVYQVSMQTTQFGQTQLTGVVDENFYFAGRLVAKSDGPAWGDRLGSLMGGPSNYFPYGESANGSVSGTGKEMFATYPREGIGLDYAQNRWYAAGVGRFITVDPSKQSQSNEEPKSWNRYHYANGNPILLYDPSGLQAQLPVEMLSGCGDQYDVEGTVIATVLCFRDSSGDGGGGGGGGGNTSKYKDCNSSGTSGEDGNLEFLVKNFGDATKLASESGIDAEVILQWAAAESDWGKSKLNKDTNNYFNLTYNLSASPINYSGNWIGGGQCADGVKNSWIYGGKTYYGTCFGLQSNGIYASGYAALFSEKNWVVQGKTYATPLDVIKSAGNVYEGLNLMGKIFAEKNTGYGDYIKGLNVSRRLECLKKIGLL